MRSSVFKGLEQRLDSDWLEDTMTGTGAFPPINVFQQGNDFVAIIEMPGVSKERSRLGGEGKYHPHLRQEDGRIWR
jgi:hypothetical protein